MRCLSVRSVSVLLAGALLVCLLLYPTSAVDRKKFRTCQDTAFCKRNRAVAADGHRGPQRFFITVSRTALHRAALRESEWSTSHITAHCVWLVVSRRVFEWTTVVAASLRRSLTPSIRCSLTSHSPSQYCSRA